MQERNEGADLEKYLPVQMNGPFSNWVLLEKEEGLSLILNVKQRLLLDF